MKHLLSDTLFRRLFILMWVALVGSHVLAFSVIMVLHQTVMVRDGAPHASEPHIPLPPFPSLPPRPQLWGSADGLELSGGHMAPHAAHAGMPTWLMVIDYGIRLLAIGAAAWWGARWLSRPIRHLADASRALSASMNQSDTPPLRLRENEGTVEVRDTAKVFNEMAARLSQQFRTRGLMMAALSHDLRTPLTRIRIRIESIAERHLAERCISDVREMNELIDTSLEVFRGMACAEPTQVTDVMSLVQSITDDFIEQGQAVGFDGRAAVTRAKPLSLKRVIINLINNAVRYGGQADVRVTQADAHVVITIDDKGPGIAADHLEDVFEPFYRVESSRNRHTGGMGLGLYIARELIRQQAGDLRLLNRNEGGLRAEVRLPLGHADTVLKQRPQALAATAPLKAT